MSGIFLTTGRLARAELRKAFTTRPSVGTVSVAELESKCPPLGSALT